MVEDPSGCEILSVAFFKLCPVRVRSAAVNPTQLRNAHRFLAHRKARSSARLTAATVLDLVHVSELREKVLGRIAVLVRIDEEDAS